MPAQSSQRQRVRGVVGQVKTAFQIQRRIRRIGQAYPPGANQAVQFGLRWPLGFQLADANQVIHR